MSKVGVVDYGMGNMKSIVKAFSHLGQNSEICVTSGQIDACDRLVIPGVGAYRTAMENLQRGALAEAIRNYAGTGRPVLGICLGMQLMSTHGTEPEFTDGLNLIPGQVVPLPNSADFRLPHVGWNSARVTSSHPLLEGIKPELDWYFVHSYQFLPAVPTNCLAVTDYGVIFASMVGRKNIIGVQFHPEKSQDHGLQFLENFSRWNGGC